MDTGAWEVIAASIIAIANVYTAWQNSRTKAVVVDVAKTIAEVAQKTTEASKTLGEVAQNTNGMSHRLEAMADAAGMARGLEAGRVIAQDTARAVAEAVAAKPEEKK